MIQGRNPQESGAHPLSAPEEESENAAAVSERIIRKKAKNSSEAGLSVFIKIWYYLNRKSVMASPANDEEPFARLIRA